MVKEIKPGSLEHTAFSFAVKRIYCLRLGKSVINVALDVHMQATSLLMWKGHVREIVLYLRRL